MHLWHIPQCTIQNRNVHISVLNGALWDMAQCTVGFVNLVYSRAILEVAVPCLSLAFHTRKSEIRKRLFVIFTVRQKWFHKHALFCKCKVSQCWMQRNLLLEPGKRLNMVRKKHSQDFLSFMNFRCISSAIWSVKLPSLAVRCGTVGTFCIAATANVS